MAAKVIWKAMYTIKGMVGAKGARAFTSIPFIKIFVGLPIIPITSAPNASGYPYKTHTILVIAKAMNDRNMVFNTFSFFVSPP